MSTDTTNVSGTTPSNKPLPKRSFNHLRNISPFFDPAGRLSGVSKAASTSNLRSMAQVSTAPGLPPPSRLNAYGADDMSTIPDPRSRNDSPSRDGFHTPSHHPDLSEEVAALSNKLINAINYQANLDDSLSSTRQELERAQDRVSQLERENREHANLVSRGYLIRKSKADLEKNKLLASLVEEQRQRADIEKEKKAIELELENLTAALFEEANKMVITAKEAAQHDHDVIQRRNDQLTAQLEDMEALLKSHQEQLAELKQVMEQMTMERDDQTNPTAPSTPGVSKLDHKDDISVAEIPRPESLPEIIVPSYPTSFTNVIQPVLRTDLSAFDDFSSLLKMSKNVPSASRASSGSYGGIGLGLSLAGYSPHREGFGQQLANASTSSLGAANGSAPGTPTTSPLMSNLVSNSGPNSLTPLKDTKFYKRTLAEDIEPTLRLDAAPGLSWLARRTILNAVCEGTLVVEPIPSKLKHYNFSCSLCGENRKEAQHERTHRFKASESENAQRYHLCPYCLGRIRSTCDFVGFLRVLKEGYWRADDEEAEMGAWEESVRLREQMFWCRLGGGVVPIPQHSTNDQTPQPDMYLSKEEAASNQVPLAEDFQPRDVTPLVSRSSTERKPSQLSITSTPGDPDSLPPNPVPTRSNPNAAKSETVEKTVQKPAVEEVKVELVAQEPKKTEDIVQEPEKQELTHTEHKVEDVKEPSIQDSHARTPSEPAVSIEIKTADKPVDDGEQKKDESNTETLSSPSAPHESAVDDTDAAENAVPQKVNHTHEEQKSPADETTMSTDAQIIPEALPKIKAPEEESIERRVSLTLPGSFE